MKSYTDIEQSRKLAEILPLESADMYYINGSVGKIHIGKWGNDEHDEDDLPCWSLSALLGVLPNGIVINKDAKSGKYHASYTHIGTYIKVDNTVDACVAMIEKLHELNLL